MGKPTEVELQFHYNFKFHFYDHINIDYVFDFNDVYVNDIIVDYVNVVIYDFVFVFNVNDYVNVNVDNDDFFVLVFDYVFDDFVVYVNDVYVNDIIVDYVNVVFNDLYVNVNDFIVFDYNVVFVYYDSVGSTVVTGLPPSGGFSVVDNVLRSVYSRYHEVMCSIAGSLNKPEVERMLRVMQHRAPDDSGVVSDIHYAIGMGRLAILDTVSPGLCPVVDGDLVLTFNGEIYNFIELRTELEGLGHEFKTRSDSEVLLKAYKQWGEDCLDKLNGMFAFAIYDGKTIFLARDIAGEKPLYYRKDPADRDSFRFASEAKALRFDCKEFPPAHCARYDLKNKTFEVRPWWTLKKREIDPKTAVEELDALLQDSVNLRTRSDVQYGLYFSGGIDSTLISTYHEFPIMFNYTNNEQWSDFERSFEKILWHLDYPVKTFSPYGLWKLAQMAHENEVKVVLSGEGADELFGGYVRYVPNEFNRRAQERFPSYKGLFPYKDMMWDEFNGNMRELLRMGDRMASAWGVENRCPFLDRRIIEFAFSLPMELKVNEFETKVILKEIIRRRLPSYQMQEKHGLFVPVNRWLKLSDDDFDKSGYTAHQETLWAQMVRGTMSS